MTNDCRHLLNVVTAVEFFFPAYDYVPSFEVKLHLIDNFHKRSIADQMDLSHVVLMVEGHCQNFTRF